MCVRGKIVDFGIPTKDSLLRKKMVKSARKSETETFGIVGRFHRFEDLLGKSTCVHSYTQHTGKNKKTKTKQKRKQNKTRHVAVTDGVPCRL